MSLHSLLLRCARRLTLPAALIAALTALATDGNRLAYLAENDPFYTGLAFPKLTTPQWVGETGVEAVVILAVDDMRAPEKYETFLRPILDRLKKIDGRAPVSIFCNALDPAEPKYQAWLKEGLSLEVHTLSHPCPLLASNGFAMASNVFFGGIEQLNSIPDNHAVAFRTPCCDSINSPSPRLFAELFNQVSPAGQYLTIDSSIMNILTEKDMSLPRHLVMETDGTPRFRKYLPFPAFKTTIEDYPYPYVVGQLCWEFPAVVPSDWEAFHIHGATNAVTVADWKAAMDATVLKQGTFTMIFHPHGWIRSDQLVELVDYAVNRYGNKVKFLNFKEAQERLNQYLLAGQPLRANDGRDNGVRLLALNNDGWLDVVIGNDQVRKTRVWKPHTRTWVDSDCPTTLIAGGRDNGVRFGVIGGDSRTMMLSRNTDATSAWRFDGTNWIADADLSQGLVLDGNPILASVAGLDRGVRLRDLNRDGTSELIVGNESQNAVFDWSGTDHRWKRTSYNLPEGSSIVDAAGHDSGLRFVDVNEDGYDDVLVSNTRHFSLHLYIPEPILGFGLGWSRVVMNGERGEPGTIPAFVRDGLHPNNGAWFHSGSLWVQNEETAHLPDLVDRRSYKELLAGANPPPKSPEESLAAIQVPPGFQVELVASEPMVEGPVAFDWSEDGKLWVVEMRDYPLGLDGHGKPGGRVVVLESTLNDGHYDKSTVFLDGLNFPNGIIAWRKGVIVSAPPDIFYAEDTDGDGKADVHEVLFTGFREGNQQHRANGFEFGLDNWLYGANGDSGGTVRSIATGKETDINYRDFRFRPGSGAFETQAGQTQFGRRRDDWGNWFGNENAVGSWHYFLPEQYVSRNRFLSVSSARQTMPNYPDYTRVFPASRLAQRFNDPQTANHLTSANSTSPYRDELFGSAFATSYFVSEPVHNLIHREIMMPSGVSFTSQRATSEASSEFLASRDNWFRPAMTKTGPDGALYIADFYRLVIEHPEWIPADFQKSVDLRAGADRGRLYRVYPTGAQLRPTPRLDRLSSPELAAAMESPNGWQRDTVQRVLAERRDPAAVPVLERLANASPNPKTRAQALCALDGMGALKAETILGALRDADSHVREHAIRVAEPLLSKNDAIGEALLGLSRDPEIRVRFQLAFTLGEWPNLKAGSALAGLALQNPQSEPIQTAVESSASRHAGAMIKAVLASPDRSPTVNRLLEHLVGLATALDDQDAMRAGLEAITHLNGNRYEPWQTGALGGFLDALDRRNITLKEFGSSTDHNLQDLEPRVAAMVVEARRTAGNIAAPENARIAAARVLGRIASERASDIQLLGTLLGPQHPPAVKSAALSALGRLRGAETATAIISAWDGAGPATRGQILDLLMSRQEWIQSLLFAVEGGRISAGALGAVRQQKLLGSRQPAIRDRAIKLFAAANSDRQSVVARFQPALALAGNLADGANHFRQNCIPCHRPRPGQCRLQASVLPTGSHPGSQPVV